MQDEPEFPRIIVDTSLPVGWDKPADATPMNSAELQLSLDNAVQDSGTYVIELATGTTYTGSFVVGNKTGTDWIIVRSSGFSVSEGTRVVDNSGMATIEQPDGNAAMRLDWGAHHVRFIGIEFKVDEAMTVFNVVGFDSGYQVPTQLSEVCNFIGYDRCYIHSTSTPNRCRTGIQVNCNNFFCIDSRIENIKDTADAQAILIVLGIGMRIENCFLESTGENIMSGGNDTIIVNSMGEDITINRCHFFKRNEWNQLHADYNGVNWGIKNLFELKMAKRVHFHSNVLEHNWVDKQVGFAILLTVRNQNGGNPWAVIEDVTIENCITKRTGRFCNILADDYLQPSEQCKRFKFRNCLVHTHGGSFSRGGVEDFGVQGRTFQIGTHARPLQGLFVEHCTFVFQEGHLGSSFISAKQVSSVDNVTLLNNIWDDGEFAWTSVIGTRMTNVTISGNGIFFNPLANNYTSKIDQTNFDNSFGIGNFKADTLDEVGFTDHENLDYSLTQSSPFNGKGVDYVELNAAILGVEDGGSPPPPPSPPSLNQPPTVNDQVFSVDENSPNGTVVGMVVATDPDGDILTYSMSANDAFALSSIGELTVSDSNLLNFETMPTFGLTARVDDPDGLFDTAMITVNLNDVNEVPVVTDQVFSVDENSPNGTLVGMVAASDPDGDVLAYSMVAMDNDAFAISSDGEITVNYSDLLNFEVTPTFVFTIRVEDVGGLFDMAMITVNLNDVDPPSSIEIITDALAMLKLVDTSALNKSQKRKLSHAIRDLGAI